MSWGVSPWLYPVWDSLGFLDLSEYFLPHFSTLPTKVHLVKAMVFPVVMHGCKSWTVKKAERRRIDAFELWCWRRLLSPNGYLLSPQSGLKGVRPPVEFEERPRDALQAMPQNC